METDSFIVAVISPERQIREQISAVFEEHPAVSTIWTLAEYPGPGQLGKLREARNGCVVFIDFSDAIQARSVASALDQSYPNAAAIAVQTSKRPEELMELMQVGIR